VVSISWFGVQQPFLLALVMLCSAHGGLHLAAWKFAFPTEVEKVLWKVTCIDIIAGSSSVIPFYLTGIAVAARKRSMRVILDTTLRFAGLYSMSVGFYSKSALFYSISIGVLSMFFVIGLINLPFFLLSRVYIVIESFTSIRNVPIGVYTAAVVMTELLGQRPSDTLHAKKGYFIYLRAGGWGIA
jgi:hypothetical protein